MPRMTSENPTNLDDTAKLPPSGKAIATELQVSEQLQECGAHRALITKTQTKREPPATRRCKRVVYEHTRTTKFTYLVPVDAEEEQLDFKMDENERPYSELIFNGLSMPCLEVWNDDEVYNPYNKWCETEEVDENTAKRDDDLWTNGR